MANTFQKSRRRANIQETAMRLHLKPMQEAGFKSWLTVSGKGLYHFRDEWNQLWEQYKSRDTK